ncbi:MAG: hypothetical protein LBJ95_03060 [Oscillospiraceae bacterium]|nr:hypothetical protein [Oscillospiraceae bacterium]
MKKHNDQQPRSIDAKAPEGATLLTDGQLSIISGGTDATATGKPQLTSTTGAAGDHQVTFTWTNGCSVTFTLVKTDLGTTEETTTYYYECSKCFGSQIPEKKDATGTGFAWGSLFGHAEGHACN